MIRRSIPVFWFFYWIGAAVLGIAALALLILKLALPNLSSYRDEVASVLSDVLDARVHIAAIDGRWDHWRPVVDIDGLSIDAIGGEEGLSLAVLDATFSFDPAASARALQPVFNQLDLRGLTIRKRQAEPEAAEKNTLASVEEEQPKPFSMGNASTGTLAWLLHQSSIRIIDARFELLTTEGERVAVSPVHLWLQRDQGMHQLQIKAQLATSTGEANIRVVAEVEGSPGKNPANFYLNIQGLDHELLNPWLKLAGIELGEFAASQEFWGEARQGKLIYLTGKTVVDTLHFADYQLGEMALHTALMRRDKSYQLQVTDVLLGDEQKQFNLPRLSLDFVREGSAFHPLTLMVDSIDLKTLNDWVSAQNFIPPEAVNVMKTLNPQGTLHNLLVNWDKGQELEQFKLAADLSRVSIDAWGDVPEIQGIDGLLLADKQAGQIHLESVDFGLFFPALFETRWRYQDAGGIIGWRIEDEGVVVASQLLHLVDESVSADGRFSIYLPKSRDEQPLLNLQIGMQNSDGLQAQYYIPPKEVGAGTYEWLVRAIKGGKVQRAGFVLNGVTRSRLDDYQSPAVQMFFDVNQASFEYHPDWPQIYKARSFVFFRNGELVVEASDGNIYDSKVDYAWVHLPKSADRLFVNGKVLGSAATLQTLLKKTPLKDEVGDGLDNWRMEGDLDALLDLQIPLYQPDKLPDIQVSTQLRHGRFYSEAEQLDFTGIKGEIGFDSATGLYAEKLSGWLFEQPVKATIDTDYKRTRVGLTGEVEALRLQRWLELPLLNITRGRLTYQAELDICPSPACNQLNIRSDLRGLEISAPAPLAKVAEQPMLLSLNSDLGNAEGKTTYRLNLANQLRGVILTDGRKVHSGRFTLGGGKPVLPEGQGLYVNGTLASLDYDQLSQFLERSGIVGGDASPKGGETSPFRQLELRLGQFTLDDFLIDQLDVKLQAQPSGWVLHADSELLAGQLWMPDKSDVPYALKLKRLTLQREEGETEGEPAPETDLQPKDLPLIDIEIAALTYADNPLGSWQLELRPTDKGAEFNNIIGQLPGTEVRGQMRWEKNGTESTNLTLKLDSGDFGQALEAWGLSKAIETKELNSYLQLSWASAPWDFSVAESNGVMQFTANNGRLLDVGNSGNFLRVFGILNLNSLSRRLRLDFSDLLKSGVAFDQMKGDYAIQQGIAETVEPFVMRGPSANFIMTGKLDLAKETVDKEIEVALPVTGNIPLVSVLLGAPQVAGAVFLFDKLIGDPLEKFTQVRYRMRGDWSDPEIDLYDQQKESDDTRGPASAVEPDNG